MRAFGALCLILILWRCLYIWPVSDLLRQVDAGIVNADGELEGGDELPQEPTALMVPGTQHARWTVSIPHNSSFPLPAVQYVDLCTEGEKFRDRILADSPVSSLRRWRGRGWSYHKDRTYLDVADAESTGVLPVTGYQNDTAVCDTSLTFAMDTDDASFGKTLLLLLMSYGMAKKEGRAFFIDDTRWPYGKYASYFAPPPLPECLPPPAHHIVPCPHQARHLLVSAATAPWTFGAAFEDAFVKHRRHGVDRFSAIYDLLRKGHEDLFQLVGEDVLYASSRIAKMKGDADSHGGAVVGMQIRRGDLHPYEYQFSRDYLPLERYGVGARKLIRSLLGRRASQDSGDESDDFSAVTEFIHSPLVLASDDPDIFAPPELSDAAAPFVIERAQERIHLATKAILDKTSPAEPIREPGSAYVKHVDENTGWEGGFYSALFYSLGSTVSKSGDGMLQRLERFPDGSGDPVSEQALRIRELVGRAYLLDLAVLGESDGVVCAVSSAACRLLGVMLGWDAVKEGRWMNIDDGRPWSWNGQW